MSNITSTPEETRCRETFHVLMNALAHPGQSKRLPIADENTLEALQVIGQTLLDLETSFYTPDPNLRETLSMTRARFLDCDQAAYQFYVQDGQDLRVALHQAPVGTMLYPDQSATLFVGCHFINEMPLTLAGPGIHGERQFPGCDLPASFWRTRAELIQYPLGWDLYLVYGSQLVGIPRTTQVNL